MPTKCVRGHTQSIYPDRRLTSYRVGLSHSGANYSLTPNVQHDGLRTFCITCHATWGVNFDARTLTKSPYQPVDNRLEKQKALECTWAAGYNWRLASDGQRIFGTRMPSKDSNPNIEKHHLNKSAGCVHLRDEHGDGIVWLPWAVVSVDKMWLDLSTNGSLVPSWVKGANSRFLTNSCAAHACRRSTIAEAFGFRFYIQPWPPMSKWKSPETSPLEVKIRRNLVIVT